MMKITTVRLKDVRMSSKKGVSLSYAKYVGKVAECVATILVMQGDVESVKRFIEESATKAFEFTGSPTEDSTSAAKEEEKLAVKSDINDEEVPVND